MSGDQVQTQNLLFLLVYTAINLHLVMKKAREEHIWHQSVIAKTWFSFHEELDTSLKRISTGMQVWLEKSYTKSNRTLLELQWEIFIGLLGKSLIY